MSTRRKPGRDWTKIPKHGALIKHNHDISLTKDSRLRLKVLVFASNRDMALFWANALDYGDMCSLTLGAVSDLSPMGIGYYAVMGLVIGAGTDISTVSHEAVHAAYAYDRRLGKRNRYRDPEQDEERICYPAGILTKEIWTWLQSIGEATP